MVLEGKFETNNDRNDVNPDRRSTSNPNLPCKNDDQTLDSYNKENYDEVFPNLFDNILVECQYIKFLIKFS